MNILILTSTYQPYPNKVIIDYQNIDYIKSSDKGCKIMTKTGHLIDVTETHEKIVELLTKLAR